MAKKKAERLLAGFFDTETTGLTLHRSAPLERQPRIIEFAMAVYDLNTRELVSEYQSLVHPGFPVSDEITKITGITNDMLNAPGVKSFAELKDEIVAQISGVHITIAHNHPFDEQMVDMEFMRMGETFLWMPRRICTVEHFKPYWGRRPKLTEVYERFMGKPLAQTHRALDDVKAMAEVCMQEEVWL